MSDGVRVRFAPSPTGHLHVGGARTALFNWLYARNQKGAFILRIEDTDEARSTEDSVDGILEAMTWLGLNWDEGPDKDGGFGPYVQSQRKHLYKPEAERLLADGKAYPCFCSAETLTALREEQRAASSEFQGYDGRCGKIDAAEAKKRVDAGEQHTLRLRTPADGETILYDVVRGKTVFQNAGLEDFVIMKSSGMPTYNFAVVVDDHAMEITHVIRGDDHLSNTPRHLLLFGALGYKVPKFAHLPMILGSDKTRLSKRHGASSVQEFAKQGILPQGMMNYLALLGWSLDGKTEFFSPKKLSEVFSLKRVGSNPSVFDPEKLAWLSGEHFVKLSPQDRVPLIHGHMISEGLDLPEQLTPELETKLGALVKLMGKRMRSANEADRRVWHFFQDLPEYDAESVAEHLPTETDAMLTELADRIEALPEFVGGELESLLRAMAEERDVKAGELIHPFRVAITGRSVSADIFRSCELVGRERVLLRLRGAHWRS